MSDLLWLARHTRRGEVGARFEWTLTPFTVTHGDAVWTCATDGHALVAVREESAAPPLSVTLDEIVIALLKRDGESAFRTTKLALREWCWREANACPKCDDFGEAKCGRCGGTGRFGERCPECDTDHNCICSFCGGSKTLPCPCMLDEKDEDIAGWLGSVLVNRDKLAAAIAVELGPADEPVDVVTRKEQVQIRGPAWTVVLMGIDPKGAPPGLYDDEDMPRFEVRG